MSTVLSHSDVPVAAEVSIKAKCQHRLQLVQVISGHIQLCETRQGKHALCVYPVSITIL